MTQTILILVLLIVAAAVVIYILARELAVRGATVRRQRQQIEDGRLALAEASRLSKIQKEALDAATERKTELDRGGPRDRFDASMGILSDLSRRPDRKPAP